ncbi:hypothetical protein ACIQXD_29240 [Streptomyces uncialis]|uniref:hypothetical protein n=1 Tax=Streptomyces uncialis TaxID=1048205 RepID=UPI0037F8AE93
MARRGFLGRFFDGRREADAADLAAIDREITAFGEALARHDFVPAGHPGDPALSADYERALDAYERAKRDFVGDRDRDDAADVLRALDDGRHALACADARIAGTEPPARLPLCFFDPRHGPAATEVSWCPPEGTARDIAVCAADGVRLAEGAAPIATGRAFRPDRAGHPARDPALRDLPPPPVANPAPPRRPRQFDLPTPPTAPQEPSPWLERGFGLLGFHTYVPREAHAPAGPTARRRTPRPGGDPDAPAPAPRPPGPYRIWSPGTPEAQRAEGRQDAEVALPRPGGPDEPVLLAVRFFAKRGGNAVELRTAGGTRTPAGGDRLGAVVPLPPDGGDTVRLALTTTGEWRAWLQPLDEVPVLADKLGSQGAHVFRYEGRCQGFRTVGSGGGRHLTVHRLTGQLAVGDLVARASGAAETTGELPGPGLYFVRAPHAGAWHLTLSGTSRR